MSCQKVFQLIFPAMLCGVLMQTMPSTVSAYNAEHLAALNGGVTSWNKMRKSNGDFVPDFSGAVIKGRNLSSIDLHGANLKGTDFSQSNLSHANLQNAQLEHSKMSGCMLMKADLEHAGIQEADLESAVIDGAKLHAAILTKSILKKADCSNTDFSGSDLRECNFREASLVNADLREADLKGTYLWRANISGAKLKGVRVSKVTILDTGKYASAAWAEKQQAVFVDEEPKQLNSLQEKTIVLVPDKNSQSENVHSQKPGKIERSLQTSRDIEKNDRKEEFREKKKSAENIWRQSPDGIVQVPYSREQYDQLKRNVFTWNDMRKRDRDMHVELNAAPFNGKNLVYADLHQASLAGANFRHADLSESDLRSADLQNTDFREANLEHADLGGADLRGANLWRANLSRTRLDGAVVSGATVLDSGKKATKENVRRYNLIFSEK
ncbi:MAG: pentapeptide repeat-containing protein [Chlorobium sp.]|nr:MAG: pentapeptide repeat-containing protein [Chlorobium sp.]